MYSSPWRDLVRVYRRLEMRGEIRGGRMVGGFVGEQFALPEALESLRAVRSAPKTGEVVTLSACDPLNLVGLITPGARVAAHLGHRVADRDGVPVAMGGSAGQGPRETPPASGDQGGGDIEVDMRAAG